MYHISTISDILRQGVDSLAQWLEHWISTPAVRVRIPSGTWDFFQAMHHLLVTNFHIRKMGARPGYGPFESFSHYNDILVIINDYFLQMGVCYVPLHHSFIRDYL